MRKRLDLSRGYELDRFVDYLLSKYSQAELAEAGLVSSARAFRDGTSWCWDVSPPMPATGEIHDVLMIDGTRVGGQVCLIARSPRYVVAWRFDDRETSTTWDKILASLPPPRTVVCDGQKGILLSLARYWPETTIQRCLFHVWLNLKAKLTLNPQTEAGRDLLEHYKCIWAVHDYDAAVRWSEVFWEIYAYHKEFISERTQRQNPAPGKRSWWYTHRDVRSAYRQIAKLLQNEQLFAYSSRNTVTQEKSGRKNRKQSTGMDNPRTTNHVEGGSNSPIKALLYLHRGMQTKHQQKLVEWYLYSKTESVKPPRKCL